MIRLKHTLEMTGDGMPFRFFRRVPIGKGLTMNISKTGASFSVGPRNGGAVTMGTSGARGTMSLPATGLFYTVDKKNLFSAPKKRGSASSRGDQGSPSADQLVPSGSPLELGFFEKLLIPKEEKRAVDGFKALVMGDHAQALLAFEQAPNSADARWIAGMIRLKAREHEKAEAHLNYALAHEQDLGVLVSKYQVDVVLRLPITPEVSAFAKPRRRGTLLALAESYQDRGENTQAMRCLKKLIQDHPDDPVVMLSLVELMASDEDPLTKATAKQIIKLMGDVENQSDIHVALMLYKARALNSLGLTRASLDTLTAAYRRKKDRDPELLQTVRYERALLYEALGQKSRARAELEGIYANDPGFEDVEKRLGLT